MTYKIPVSRPSISGIERELVAEVMESGWISSQGPMVKKFEDEFAEMCGAKYAVAVSSGTNALQLAVEALHLSPGNEVIVPEFTMIASAWAVEDAGAVPVFVDCGDDLNIDVKKIEEKITKQTRAIMPVHIYGRKCSMREIREIGYEYGLRVIEDSCEAHGVQLGSDIACFSLFANKIISAGEGGVCVTNDKYFAEQIRHLRGMAFSYAHNFQHKKKAHNFRITSLQCAVALGQTQRINSILEKRAEIERWYNEGLADIKQITIMPKRDVLWMYDILAENRDKLVEFLELRGIETRVYFYPMSMQPMFFFDDVRVTSSKDTKAFKFSQRGMYLPTFTDLERSQVDDVCNAIKQFYD